MKFLKKLIEKFKHRNDVPDGKEDKILIATGAVTAPSMISKSFRKSK